MSEKSGFNETIIKMTGIPSEILIILYGVAIYMYSDSMGMIKSILITSFVLAIFDLYLKNIILLNYDDDYHVFIINNIITIVTIDVLITAIHDKNSPKFTLNNYCNIAFACLFYETIVFKLYNYNNYCNKRLRSVTKTILRLATIHILSTYISEDNFDEKWFNFSFGQIFSFSLYNTVFEE
jgi:hypothetical protein